MNSSIADLPDWHAGFMTWRRVFRCRFEKARQLDRLNLAVRVKALGNCAAARHDLMLKIAHLSKSNKLGRCLVDVSNIDQQVRNLTRMVSPPIVRICWWLRVL